MDDGIRIAKSLAERGPYREIGDFVAIDWIHEEQALGEDCAVARSLTHTQRV